MAGGVRQKYGRLAAGYDHRWGDVGCGTGALLALLSARSVPGAQLTGVDLVPAMLRIARAKLPGAVRLVAGDAGGLLFDDRTFDVVVSSSSLHLWSDASRALRDIARVLVPGGRLVITGWCDDFLACRVCDLVLRLADRAHQRSYSRTECATLLAGAGYTVESIERYKIDWMWGLMTPSARLAKPG